MTSSSIEVAAAGFNFDSASKVIIVDSNVTDVSGVMAGIFGSTGGTLEISGSRFERATAAMAGAFMGGSGSTTLTMRDSLLRDIGRETGGPTTTFLYDGPTATISGCRFQTSPVGWFYVAKVTATFLPHPRCRTPLASPHTVLVALLSSRSLSFAKGFRHHRQLSLRPTSIWTLAPWR